MNFLVVAATRGEVAPLIGALRSSLEDERILRGTVAGHRTDILVTGVGMVATAVWCTRALAAERYDVAINLGVCGSFNAALPPPVAVHVTSDMLPELGVEDGPKFVPLQDVGLLDVDSFPFTGGRLVNAAAPSLPGLADLPAVSGITVNTVHGDDASIAVVVDRCAPDVESMEGAAFAYACLAAGVPFAQVRAVSNYVERRNRAAWTIDEAFDTLSRVTAAILGDL